MQGRACMIGAEEKHMFVYMLNGNAAVSLSVCFGWCCAQGRACMIGAVEKQKFVYVLNRDAAANLTISSPLEAHKTANIVFSCAGLDMGFDNPVFAAIELDYSDADQVQSRSKTRVPERAPRSI